MTTMSCKFFSCYYAMAMVMVMVMAATMTINSIEAFTFAFQQPLRIRSTTINSTTSKATPIKTSTSTSTSTSLHVKFRLDNDDDESSSSPSSPSSPPSAAANKGKQTIDKTTNTNYDETQYEYENLYQNEGPQTTFGAEAVPEAQRPANEYMELLSSPLFDWANRDGGGDGTTTTTSNGDAELALRLGVLYAVLFGLVCWPISGATFTMRGYELHQFFSSNVGALGFVLIIVLRLYTGWGYVGSRLQSKEIEYEETGWYDGDIELKTEAEIARDLFLYRQDVKPVVERLQKFAIGVGSLWIASCIGLNVMFNVKPMFNEYDPEMLKTLNYDDKRAGVAAEQSNGRPTYCDSRYYRAVANGGQGECLLYL